MDALPELAKLISGKSYSPAAARPTGAHEGVVLEILAEGAVVQLPEWDRDKRFGPMPFCRTDTPPVVGDKCLVLFLGTGIARSWLLAWTSP